MPNLYRDGKLRHALVHRLDEIEQQLKLESKQRVSNEKDWRINLEAVGGNMKVYTDESADSIRKIISVSI